MLINVKMPTLVGILTFISMINFILSILSLYNLFACSFSLLSAPQSVPHFAMKDTTFAGYDIPKGTVIIFHLYSALMDPDAWDHPEEFKPERFLNQNGEFDDKKESFIPFSIGKFQLNLITFFN